MPQFSFSAPAQSTTRTSRIHNFLKSHRIINTHPKQHKEEIEKGKRTYSAGFVPFQAFKLFIFLGVQNRRGSPSSNTTRTQLILPSPKQNTATSHSFAVVPICGTPLSSSVPNSSSCYRGHHQLSSSAALVDFGLPPSTPTSGSIVFMSSSAIADAGGGQGLALGDYSSRMALLIRDVNVRTYKYELCQSSKEKNSRKSRA